MGETGEIFTKENSYFKNTPKKILSDLDYYKDGNILISTKAKKFTTSENEKPRVEREYENRIITARALQQYFKKETKVLPEIKPSYWAYDYHFDGVKEYGKVPDFKIGDDFWEMESYDNKYRKKKLWHMIKEGAKQAEFIAIKLNEFVPLKNISYQMQELINTKFDIMPKKVFIIDKEGSIIYTYEKEHR